MEEQQEFNIKIIMDNLRNHFMDELLDIKPPPYILERKKKIHVQELLNYDLQSFIKNAYRLLLHREAERQGLEYYNSKLAHGYSKIDIIQEIRKSTEGKRIKVKIKGLYQWLMINFVTKKLTKKIWSSDFSSWVPQITQHINQLESSQHELKIKLQELYRLCDSLKARTEHINDRLREHTTEFNKLSQQLNAEMADFSNWDEFYSKFEDKFRGSYTEIKQRCMTYLPFIKNIVTASKTLEECQILDIGCGRGEWLDVLKENHFNAYGIDMNKTMIDRCSKKELTVVEGDAISHLQQLPANSLRAITAFHVIEHLSFPSLIKMLDEIYRVMEKDGVVILETPNPNNVVVGSCGFYYDPTHKKPLPPYLMQFVLEQKGFRNLQILGLNADTGEMITDDNKISKLINEYFYGPHDYAIIGYR